MAPAKKNMDTAELAVRVVRMATGELPNDKPKQPDAAAVERGHARAEHLDPKQRKDIAKKAADVRWKKEKGDS